MQNLNIIHLAAQRSFDHFELWRSNPKGGIEFNYIELSGFLTTRGYFLFRISAQKHIYIRIIDNIVSEVGKKDLKDEILNFVKKEEDSRVYEFFLKKIGLAVNDEFLETLPAKEVEFKKDQKDAMQLYFQNCIVKVTKDGIKSFPYTSLNACIWESQIIQRQFNIDAEPGSDFRTFCFNISNKDNDRYFSLCSTIGYLIHNFKNPARSPAVILNDEVISDHPEGGTGKGILIKAIQQYLKTTTIEGKTFNFDKSFVYQQVDTDTKILAFQDVNKSFDFERLFSVITDGITVEKKGMQAKHMDFSDSPKIIISTNTAIRGSGNSHDRRRNELEISQHYNKSFTPFKEFGKMIFYDWDKVEWMAFDAFIIDCCKYYLTNGLLDQVLINLPEKKLIAETNTDFIKFMVSFNFEMISKSDLHTRFVNEYDEYLGFKWFSKQLFTKWVVAYSSAKGYAVEDYSYQSVRYYKFKLQI